MRVNAEICQPWPGFCLNTCIRLYHREVSINPNKVNSLVRGSIGVFNICRAQCYRIEKSTEKFIICPEMNLTMVKYKHVHEQGQTPRCLTRIAKKLWNG